VKDNLARVAERGWNAVIGTTGWQADEAECRTIADQAGIGVIASANFSMGMNVFRRIAEDAARRFASMSDVGAWIHESHHIAKKDAPSGTALMLGRAAADGRGVALDKHSVRSRDGHTGARKAGDIGYAALRGGTVVGEHTVIFAGAAERVELTHKAEDRMIFARGALHAARWARAQKPGLYSMMDVLGLKDF